MVVGRGSMQVGAPGGPVRTWRSPLGGCEAPAARGHNVTYVTRETVPHVLLSNQINGVSFRVADWIVW